MKIIVGLLLVTVLFSDRVLADSSPLNICSDRGIGSTKLVADAPVTIVSVSTGATGDQSSAVPYCLVKVRVPQAINIWVGLPMGGKWNGRLQSLGTGGYGGIVGVPTGALAKGYVGIQTDTGHSLTKEEIKQIGQALPSPWGDFGMLASGVPNTPLQTDFAYRSQHLTAVIGKQLTQAFYGRAPRYSYWIGYSEGGREGLRMAQQFPADFDGILAACPAIQWDRLAASQIWPQVVMKDIAGGVINASKQKLATQAAMAACDGIDKVMDGIITDPRKCRYSAAADGEITKKSCTSKDDTCLTPQEAIAIDKIWEGPTNSKGEVLWPGVERGPAMQALAGPKPFVIAVDQPRYWVFFDPTWDWRTLTIANYEEFFRKSVRAVNPILASDNPDLSAFRARGGKMITWHGFNDPGIPARGPIQYYEQVVEKSGKGYRDVQQFYRFFLAPGVEHCGGGNAPQPIGSIEALEDWVERGKAPERLLAVQQLDDDATRTRPLCPYPAFAKYVGHGSTDDVANFDCVVH